MLRTNAGAQATLDSATASQKALAAQLLGAFEPLPMGWRSRSAVLGAHHAEVVTGGVFRGVALASGRSVAVWRFRGQEIALAPHPGVELDPATDARISREARAVVLYLGRRPALTGGGVPAGLIRGHR